MSTSQNKKPSEIIFREVGILTNKTMEYHSLIKSAKTKAKVDFYYKKMVKNNKKIEVLLNWAHQLQAKEKAAEQTPPEEPKLQNEFASIPTVAA